MKTRRADSRSIGFLGSGNEPLSASLWVWEHCKLPPWRGLCPSRPVGISHYRYSRRHLYIVVTFRVNRRRRLTFYVYISRRRREMYGHVRPLTPNQPRQSTRQKGLNVCTCCTRENDAKSSECPKIPPLKICIRREGVQYGLRRH